MDTVRDCPTDILRAIAATASEGGPLYWATADLTSSGHYQDGWLVATPKAVHLVIDGQLTNTVERTDAVRFEARVMTGSGVFLVTRFHESRALAWFSRGHAPNHQRLAAVLVLQRDVKAVDHDDACGSGWQPRSARLDSGSAPGSGAGRSSVVGS